MPVPAPDPKPVCFMIMPFGRKPTQVEAGKGPAEVDFNALWDQAFVPAIHALGYEPVRADQDTGALIVHQMLERLYFSELVLAEMSIPNGNVYYEVGIRHASKETGCVLLAADWSRQLFDVAQMRTVRYPLPEGDVVEASARAVQAAIQAAIPNLARGRSPMHASLPGFPEQVDPEKASSIRSQLDALSAFQAKVRAARLAPPAERPRCAAELVQEYGRPPMVPAVAIGLLRLVVGSVERDEDWQRVLDFLGRLPPELAGEAYVREQRALALSKLGKHFEAIGELEELARVAGPTSEREGLLGGRYKALIKADPEGRLKWLNQAIEHYEAGMMLDLNDYYPSSNLPRLYRTRGRKGDEERAQSVQQLVIAACNRALKRGVTDEWLRPALLGTAFDAGNVEQAEELCDQIEAEGADTWMLKTTFDDLERSVGQLQDTDRRAALAVVLERLRALL